jgi:hypothetical protein
MIFVNLAVSDVAHSRTFYEGLYFAINPQFPDETVVCVVVSDTIYLMVLNHTQFADFAPHPIADTHKTAAALSACPAKAPGRPWP